MELCENIKQHDCEESQSCCFYVCIFGYGLRMKTFNTKDTKVKPNNIRKVAWYPPVASSTLLDTVAMSDPPITVKVISAMFVEKYFIPKKEEVNAAVMVGQEP